MMQMQPALFQSEIGIRLPFPGLSNVYRVLGQKSPKACCLLSICLTYQNRMISHKQ